MDVQIRTKSIDLAPEVRDYIERRLRRINRHLPDLKEPRVELFHEETRAQEERYGVQITLNSNGTLLRGEERGASLLAALDKVTDVMDRQVERYKGKLLNRSKGAPLAKDIDDMEPFPAEMSDVVRIKRFIVKPMSPGEAIEQMEYLGHDFFLFLNSDEKQINLVYRRKDRGYGLISPELG